MIDFLRDKSIKAFHEISEIAERPDLLFSNDKQQYQAEARYNFYTIQRLNKLIRKDKLSLNEFKQLISFIEDSWSSYLSRLYPGKPFVFYCWGDYQIPAFRVSVVSFYEGVDLPFGCVLEKVNDISQVLSHYVDIVKAGSIEVSEAEEEMSSPESDNNDYKLMVYSKRMIC
ncbi:hypothetical protein NSU18_15765 [Paenibacillus sp. FSL H8-0048]|uniref:hypothetical protein n=1 Tax=Paenibacillus sp. FSL H8-0048 TaxID=2954508 RepID=UPI0030F8FDFE